MRLSTPRSRRNTMLKASAVNVVDITLMPAIAGTSMIRSRWLLLRIAPPAARNSSGSTKLKKAALGLRQNIRRSRRYWRQLSVSVSSIGRQLQIDVLERGARHRELLQALAALERLPGQLVQQPRRVIGLELHELAVAGAVGHAIVRRAHAELARRADRQDAPVLDDRHAVGERLGLLEIMGGQQDRLAQVAQRAHRLPGGAPRLGIEPRGGLVEEDQLGVAHERQREIEPPQLAP